MAITRAQQARQMLKEGSEPVVQGGVENYLGRQPEVQAPRKWQSGPNKPPTELAYITEAEKDLLLKEDIHGSLKDGPNEGPAGIISLDSFGDIGGGQAGSDVSRDTDRGKDTGRDDKTTFSGGAPGESPADRKAREAKETARLNQLKTQQEERAKEMRKDARATRKRMSDLKKEDRKKRQQRIKDILGGKFGVNNPFGLSPTELRDLQVLGYDPTLGLEGIGKELGAPGAITGPNEFTADILSRALEKSDRLSGVNLETFQNRTLDDIGAPSLPGPLLSILRGSGLIDKGMKVNREFFSDRDLKNIFGGDRKSVLEAGKLTYDGLPISQSQFEMLSPAEMEEVYGDYMDRRSAGEIDAYGNPLTQRDDGPSDPCLGPNPPAYCFIGKRAETPPEAPTFTPAFRFMNRGGMVEDAPMGTGIMDLEAARQMMFLGGIAKGIKKGLKGVTRAAKKVFKSPFGKAALLAAPFVMGGGGGALGSFFGKGSFNPFLRKVAGDTAFSGLGEALSKIGLVNKSGGLTAGGIGSLFGVTSLLSALQKPKEDDFDIEDYYEKEGLRDFIASLGQRNRFLAEGGKAEPVAKKTMPLLDLDGQEMDFRAEGGFVPIGRMEKADDVPARLSKNEFVFTAEAVRNAGDGDVDKGAEVMYNTMKNLEAGGTMSEESQGQDGAKEMFQTAQRLGEVI
jgi:hypothetical protein